MLAVIYSILEKCRARGVHCCLHCGTAEYAADMAKKGFSLVTVSSDARFVELGAASAVAKFRQKAV